LTIDNVLFDKLHDAASFRARTRRNRLSIRQ